MRDYSKGKIYHIVCNITGETYYGSTVQKISQRMNGHRNKDNECLSKPIIERGDYHYGLVEDYKCDNLEQLLMRERYYVDNNDCVNKICPIRTKEEGAVMKKLYYQEHIDEILAYKKLWREENKKEIRAKEKAYWEEHKDEKIAYNKSYREKHIDEILVKKKLYYEANKDRILAQQKAKYLLKKQAEK